MSDVDELLVEWSGDLVDEWERLEGESMREGHRATLERLVTTALGAAYHLGVRDRG